MQAVGVSLDFRHGVEDSGPIVVANVSSQYNLDLIEGYCPPALRSIADEYAPNFSIIAYLPHTGLLSFSCFPRSLGLAEIRVSVERPREVRV
jgi:hypothetical protein